MQPLTPVADQRVVIVGGSSGIGRLTARRFARAGARVAVAARNQHALDTVVQQIERDGGQAVAIPADVAREADVTALAERAAASLGGIDTWVNVAGVSVYGAVRETTTAEIRRVMEVNFFGQVYGARAALPYLEREGVGALICVGSVLSELSVPMQMAYCASKHAVKALTESLRVELRQAGSRVQVTLIKPSSIDTPFFANARTRMGVQPRPVFPVYDPELVAKVIVYAAGHRAREITVGGGGKFLGALESFAGPLVDRALVIVGTASQRTDTPKAVAAPTNLDAPLPGTGAERGGFGGRRVSAYTWARLHPRLSLAAAAAGGIGGVLVRRRSA